MREIKLRAWFEVHGKMVYDLGFDDKSFGEHGIVWDNDSCDENGRQDATLNYKLMQFTGLHDKNGKEIYEGDIVHGSYGIPPRGVTSVIEYEGSAFVINTKGHNPESVTLKTGIECLDLEVWGNIHENPELIS